MLGKSKEYKRFVWEFDNLVKSKKHKDNIIFLCIGTNKLVGDCFGPAVGSFLKQSCMGNKNVRVIGDLDNSITYKNIKKNVVDINKIYNNSLIIVLDSALSTQNNVGKIFIQNKGLRYAESLKKNNSVIGNISIKAVVAEDTNNRFKNFNKLKNVSYNSIEVMSNLVGNGIVEVLNKI